MRSNQWLEIEDAESMPTLYARVHAALRDLGQRTGTGALVAHAGVARAVQAICETADPSGLYDLKKAKNALPYLVEIPYADLLSADPLHATHSRVVEVQPRH